MKKSISTLLILLITFSAFAQQVTEAGSVKVTEDGNKTTVTIGEDLITFEESQDTTKVKIGNKGVTIIEDEDGNEIEWSDLNDEGDDDDNDNEKKNKKFKPHWAGFEVGINNYMDKDFQMNLPDNAPYMDLNTGRSWNFNLNILEYGLGLGTDKVGLVTGLGFEWNNYHFDGGNVVYEDSEGNIQPYYLPEENASIDRAKLQTTYLTAPLLLEFQIPAGKKRIHLSGGVIGGVKIGSKTKMVYTVSGDKQKDKVKDDFNLNSLRYGFTARLGYRSIKLYANYYPVSLFESGKGPELYPYSVGLTLLSF